MNSFGEYIQNKRKQLKLPFNMVTAELDIVTSILSKIVRNELVARKEILPTFVKSIEVQENKIQIEFIKSTVLTELGYLEFFTSGLKNVLNKI